MKLKSTLASSLAFAALSFVMTEIPALAEQFYFKVQNSANLGIKELYVSHIMSG